MTPVNRIYKVFCSRDKQKKVIKGRDVVARYDSFVIVETTQADAKALRQSYPVEDITKQYVIRIGDTVIDTSKHRIDETGRVRPHQAYKGVKHVSSGKHHYLVQFVGPVKASWLTGVKRAGGEPRAPIANFTHVVRCTLTQAKALARLPYVRWIGHMCHRDRVHLLRGKKPLPRTRYLPGTYSVEFFDNKDMSKAASSIKRLGASIVSTEPSSAVMTIRVDGTQHSAARIIADISAVHGVRSIRQRAIKRTSNNVATGIMGAGAAVSPPLNLSGKGETIAICDTGIDTGRADNIHPDFKGRVMAIKSFPISASLSAYVYNPNGDDGAADFDSGHGTHVAGSALGSGAASATLPGLTRPIRGLAHKSKLLFQAVEQEMEWRDADDYLNLGRYILAGIPDDLTTLFRHAYQNGARIHSNSWGGGNPGEYDASCRQLDEFVWKKRDFCVLVAAGNDGTDFDGDGKINEMSVTSPATAKNCITVGASESLRRQFDRDRYGGWWPGDYPVPPYRDAPMANSPTQVAAFSSRGPTQDGRIKPDVVAPGTFILSTRSRLVAGNNTGWAAFPQHRYYFYMGGTSMATPLVAGTVALIREYLRTWTDASNPSAALLKAVLISGATRLPGRSGSRIADVDQGFGLVNLDQSVSPRAYFVDEATGLRTGRSHEYEVSVRSRDIPLKITLAYSDFPGERLVNNLNLFVTSPSGNFHAGNSEDGFDPDSTNNVEVVRVAKPAIGKWTVQVVASDVPQGPQPYALCLDGNISM